MAEFAGRELHLVKKALAIAVLVTNDNRAPSSQRRTKPT
jgi:hypothetical protein